MQSAGVMAESGQLLLVLGGGNRPALAFLPENPGKTGRINGIPRVDFA